MLDITAISLVVTALLAYLNHRVTKLPTTIGVMVIALVMSLAIIALNRLGLDHGLRQFEESFIRSIDFSQVLMQGMLSFLLFAGALHVDAKALKKFRWQVASLAIVGTSLSTLIVGVGLWFVLPFVGVSLSLLHCLLFGALISPTDPIAVMGILKSANAPADLELVIAGESLFNDGVGVVLFALILGMITSGDAPSVSSAFGTLLREAGGGIVFGLIVGYVTFRLLKSIDQYQVEVLLTLAAVMGGYVAASHLHVSGPLAMVVIGLWIGNEGRALAMSDHTRRYIDMFWELLDEILNAVLFVLIGMEVLLIAFPASLIAGGVVCIGVALFARSLTVGIPVAAMPRLFNLPRGSAAVLTWGGLRGGISVALALSLPLGDQRDTLLALTYIVVVFSILVQGLTIGKVTRRSIG